MAGRPLSGLVGPHHHLVVHSLGAGGDRLERVVALLHVDGEVLLEPSRELLAGEDLSRLQGIPLQDHVHLVGALEAVVGVARQHLADELQQAHVHLGVDRRDVRNFGPLYCLDGGQQRRPDEQRLVGQQLVEDGAQREEVRAPVQLAPLGLLRGHVAVLALDLAALGLGGALHGLGDAEVDELHRALVGHEDVLGADIPVHDVERLAGAVLLVVGVVQGVADPEHDVKRHAHGDDPLLLAEPAVEEAQVLALNVLHGDEVLVVALAELEDLPDIGVIQIGGDLGLVDEHGDEVFVVRHVRQDPLDGEELLKALSAGGPPEEDLGHAASADTLYKFITSEFLGQSVTPSRSQVFGGSKRLSYF